MARLALQVILVSLAAGLCLPARAGDEARIQRIERGLRPYCWALFGDEPRLTIQQRMKHYQVPGVSLAVIEKGQLAWARAYGVKNVDTSEPVTADTLFQAASISKALCAAAVMKKAEQGKLALDQDVNRYLRSWRIPENEFSAQGKVTLSRLLSHTAGIGNFNDRSGYLGYRPGDPLPTIGQLLRGEPPSLTRAVALVAPPGSGCRYSNPGYAILQLVLMELENKPFARVMEETVLAPLGMSRSVFQQPLDAARQPDAATAHEGGRPLAGGCRIYPELAAGGLWSTPGELARFIGDHWLSLRGRSRRLLSRESAARMIAPADAGGEFGHGFQVMRLGGETYYGHRGGNYGFYSDMIIDAGTGNGAIVMVNGGGDRVTSNLRREILIAIAEEYGWKGYLPPRLRAAGLAPGQAGRFAGRFLVSEDGVLEIAAGDGGFRALGPDGEEIELVALGENELAARSILPLRLVLRPPGGDGPDAIALVSPAGESLAPRLAAGRRVPSELLAAGEIDRAVALYRELRQRLPGHADVSESRINRLGYRFLGRGRIREAIALLALNTEWYPGSANTHDSLAEAFLAAGDRKRARENYREALRLNPESASAREALKKLEDE